MFNLTNNIIAVDICNTIADVISVINARLGHNPNPAEYFHPALWDKPYYFEENLDIFLEAKPIASSIEILNELSIYNEIIYTKIGLSGNIRIVGKHLIKSRDNISLLFLF